MFSVVIDLATYTDKEGAFQKAIKGVLRISILAFIKTTKEKARCDVIAWDSIPKLGTNAK